MASIGTTELIFCVVIALLVLGPDRLPSAARSVGKLFSEFRKISSDLSDQVKTYIDEAPEQDSTEDGRDYSQSSPATSRRFDNLPSEDDFDRTFTHDARQSNPQPSTATPRPNNTARPANSVSNDTPRATEPPDISQFAVIPDPRHSPRSTVARPHAGTHASSNQDRTNNEDSRASQPTPRPNQGFGQNPRRNTGRGNGQANPNQQAQQYSRENRDEDQQ